MTAGMPAVTDCHVSVTSIVVTYSSR
jgi:hypothetical protein